MVGLGAVVELALDDDGVVTGGRGVETGVGVERGDVDGFEVAGVAVKRGVVETEDLSPFGAPIAAADPSDSFSATRPSASAVSVSAESAAAASGNASVPIPLRWPAAKAAGCDGSHAVVFSHG